MRLFLALKRGKREKEKEKEKKKEKERERDTLFPLFYLTLLKTQNWSTNSLSYHHLVSSKICKK